MKVKRNIKEIDDTGLHIFLGIIDTYVYFNEPGRQDCVASRTVISEEEAVMKAFTAEQNIFNL